jgi:hypothetical protein
MNKPQTERNWSWKRGVQISDYRVWNETVKFGERIFKKKVDK